jgi:hypothetical protein
MTLTIHGFLSVLDIESESAQFEKARTKLTDSKIEDLRQRNPVASGIEQNG